MEFNVNFSKKNSQRFYLPGQEIKISRTISRQKSFTTESDNVLTCRQRTYFSMLCFSLVYLVLAVRVGYVCLSDGINIDASIAKEKRIDERDTVIKNPLLRADILDRNGEVIATSLPTVNLYANTKKMHNIKDAAEKLNFIFPEISYERFSSLLSRKGAFIYLKRNLSPMQQSQVNALGIPGLEFENCETRIYPHKNLFSHILGKANVDNKGISGFENYMDERLTSSTKPVQLSVDLGVQNVIRDELLAGVEKFRADGAAAILMDVNNGRVLSMVSVPDFDPNENIKVEDRAMFNFATKAVYEAGSVFKVFNTALGLESGKVKMTDRYDTSRPLVFGRHRIKDPHGSNGMLSPEDILVESSNQGSVMEVMKVGKKYQREFLKKIKIGDELTGFEVTETAKPNFLDEKRWADITMATVSYGYGISTTPLNIIAGFSSIVNGGIYYEPTLVEDKVNEGTRVISEKNSEKMRTMLRAVVERGTGKRANVQGYQVLGKTGSADKMVGGRYERKKSVSTFISAFPASKPQYALLVVFDAPQGIPETYGHREAGWNAVPVTYNIISAVAPQLNVKADFDLEKQKSIVDAAYKK